MRSPLACQILDWNTSVYHERASFIKISNPERQKLKRRVVDFCYYSFSVSHKIQFKAYPEKSSFSFIFILGPLIFFLTHRLHPFRGVICQLLSAQPISSNSCSFLPKNSQFQPKKATLQSSSWMNSQVATAKGHCTNPKCKVDAKKFQRIAFRRG